MNEAIAYDFTFTPAENAALSRLLASLSVNPYTDHFGFIDALDELVGSGEVPQRLRDFCDLTMLRDFAREPWVVIGNAPIDTDLPVFDPRQPVQDKYLLKKTFVAEGFLGLYARLTGTEIIGHLSVNDGDFFHDIYPKESMFETQSQKTLRTLRFHRDFANHFVSPDFVNTLTLRSSPANEVLSTFTPVAAATEELDDHTRAVLGERRFRTPFDDVSTRETTVELGATPDHAVLSEHDGARVFEGRTVGCDEEAQRALDAFVVALHRRKQVRTSLPGDSVSFSNRHVIHGREVGRIGDLEELKRRWLMKTHNVFSLSTYEDFFVSERYGVVNG